MSLDTATLADDRIGRDDCRGVNAWLITDGFRREEGRDLAEGGAGRLDDDAGKGEPGRILRGDENGGRAARLGIGLVLGIAQKGDLAGLSRAKIVDAGNGEIGTVALDRTADKFGERAYGMHGHKRGWLRNRRGSDYGADAAGVADAVFGRALSRVMISAVMSVSLGEL